MYVSVRLPTFLHLFRCYSIAGNSGRLSPSLLRLQPYLRMSPFCTRFFFGRPILRVKDKFGFSRYLPHGAASPDPVGQPFRALEIERRHVGFVGFNQKAS